MGPAARQPFFGSLGRVAGIEAFREPAQEGAGLAGMSTNVVGVSSPGVDVPILREESRLPQQYPITVNQVVGREPLPCEAACPIELP